jgi:hemerythrin-like domain-containing protein
MKIQDALAEQHTVLCALFDEIKSELPGLTRLAEVRLLTRIVQRLLIRHGELEESTLLPALDHLLEDRGQRDRFYEEHEELDSRLRRVHIASQLPEARRLLREALEASRRHFCHEETVLFPLADSLFSDETPEALVQVRHRQPTPPAVREQV